jgi:ribonuclease-3
LSFLDQAVTHSSYTNEQRVRGISAPSNERLEFLGDAVLQIAISEYLYDNYKKFREGALTKMRQKLVCEKTLAEIAETISLGDYINLGHGEEQNDCRKRPKILADALEALIGAVYLDSRGSEKEGFREVVLRLFGEEIISASVMQKTDYKTKLQQLTEQEGTSVLEYKILSESGPEHSKIFEVAAYVNNNEVGRGIAPTKKEAEMQAAKKALLLFGVPI